ncbi:MAG TPA: protein kinase, partial [Gemmatimonadales bacterium]|nr:protein kinase [Gemmatimonadales bacterium]
ICPRCAVGDISDQTHECTLCGFSPAGVATLADPFPRELEASARRDLEHEFQIEGVLGQGPRGVVYLALEREQNRLVALKIIPRTPGMAPEADGLLQREASLAASLDHPHIVPIYRAGATRIFLWYAMEYSNGRSLADALAATDQTAPDWPQCVRIVHQVSSALDYAHRRGMTHGGIKPGNVLIDSKGWARITDFGIARAFGRPTAVFGADAPAEQRYLAPEQFASRNLTGPSVDQYGLAVLAHDCLRGLPPTPHVLEALQRATSEHPSERFATILDFVAGLEADSLLPQPIKPSPLTAIALPLPPTPRRSPSHLTAPLVVIDPEAAPPPRAPRVSVAAPRHRARAILLSATVLFAGVAAAAWWWLHAPPAQTGVDPSAFVLQPTTSPEQARAPAGSTSVTVPAPSVQPAPAPIAQSRTPATQRPAPVIRRPAPGSAPSPRRLASAAAEGHLLLNTQPWSEVYVDGIAVGNTPKSDLPVAPGTHHLRFTRDGFRAYETTVVVAAGASVRLTDIVLSPSTP